jgi:hypothetical protein
LKERDPGLSRPYLEKIGTRIAGRSGLDFLLVLATIISAKSFLTVEVSGNVQQTSPESQFSNKGIFRNE